MNVNRNDFGITIHLTDHEANLLQAVLGGVVDNTESQSLDRLHERLDFLNVFPTGTVTVAENQMYTEDEHDFDPFTHNFVIED